MNRTSNHTFNDHGEYHWNACVGDNGFNDTYQYALGFLKGAEILLDSVLDNNRTSDVDISIYPIGYNARHGVELILKAVLYHVQQIRSEVHVNPRDVYVTHDLSNLWLELKEKLALVDRRFILHITTLEEHINDYSQIDATGQVFRYARDLDTNQQNLVQTPIINLSSFRERFRILKPLLERFYEDTLMLQEEYFLGTYTSKLSRHDLEDIAPRIPQRDNWDSEAFSKARTAIMSEYNLSSKDYQRALDLIQAHPTFAGIIGSPLPIPHVDETALQILLNNDIGSLTKLPRETIAALASLSELGRHRYVCENYWGIFEIKLAAAGKGSGAEAVHGALYNLDAPNFKRNLLIGLERMGWVPLAEKLRSQLPPPSAISSLSSNEDLILSGNYAMAD